MIPILIATARSGSSIISNLMYQIGKDSYGYKNYLNEFFTVTELFQTMYEVKEGIICQSRSIRKNEKWFNSARDEKLQRLELIKTDPLYAIKVFAEDIEPEILTFLKENFKPVYLERKNKVDQFLSFTHMLSTNTAAYDVNSDTRIDKIFVEKKHIPLFLQHIKNFYRLRQQLPSTYPTMYYEDFMASEDQTEFIKNYFSIENYNERPFINSKSTPYDSFPESLIVNKQDWQIVKNLIEKLSIEKHYGS